MNDLIRLHAAHLRAAGMRPRTIEAAIDALDRLDRHLTLDLGHASRAELEGYLGNPNWKPATRTAYYFHAAKFYRWATDPDIDLLDHNPMERIPRPRVPKGVPRPLTDGQVETILTRARDPFRLFALIALETGLRCCEIAELHRDDVTESGVYIRRAKGGASATVPGQPVVLLEALRDFPPGLVAVAAGGVADAKWISKRSVDHFKRALNMPGVSLHRCRHTFARRIREAGGDAFLIKRALRHSSLVSTQIYVGASDEECRQAMRGLTALPYKVPVAC